MDFGDIGFRWYMTYVDIKFLGYNSRKIRDPWDGLWDEDY